MYKMLVGNCLKHICVELVSPDTNRNGKTRLWVVSSWLISEVKEGKGF